MARYVVAVKYLKSWY